MKASIARSASNKSGARPHKESVIARGTDHGNATSRRPGLPHSSVRAVPPIVNDVLRSSGQPLDTETRIGAQQSFGQDFSAVRLHTDSKASASVKAVDGLAYTFGNDIVLREGLHAPLANAEKGLLYHELTHTVQQRNCSSTSPTLIGSSRDPFEREAERIASMSRRGDRGPSRPIAEKVEEPRIQRALPAALATAGSVAEVGLTAAIVLQEQHTISQGKLTVRSETASRMGNPPQPKNASYKKRIFTASSTSPLYPEIFANFYVHWQGNDYGEIGAAYVDVAPEHPKFSYSSLDANFTPLPNLPNQGDDPRAWPMQWRYDGSFDPAGPGDYEFSGSFEINAFGGFKILRHEVIDQSVTFNRKEKAYEFVAEDFDRIVDVPPPPGKPPSDDPAPPGKPLAGDKK